MEHYEFVQRRDYLRENIDLVDYIGKYAEIHKIGELYSCKCPLHNDDTPSLRIYPKGLHKNDGTVAEYASWYCFGCHKGGDILTYVKYQHEMPNVISAIELLTEQYDIKWENGGNAHLIELQKRLQRYTEESNEVRVRTLTEINCMCSMMLRNYLKYVYANADIELFEREWKYVQGIYAKLDYMLNEHSAKDNEQLIDITVNTVQKRKRKIRKEIIKGEE